MMSESNVLIVEDDAASLKIIKDLLKRSGIRVMAVPSGKLALRAVKKAAPDLILLDVKLPDIDGFDVCRKLKSDTRFAGIPVLFLTASGDFNIKSQAFKAGGIDYITKPFEEEEVLARVHAHINLYKAKKNLDELVAMRTAELQEKEYIINSASSMISTADLEGKVNYANPSFLEGWGFRDVAEVLGYSLSELWEDSEDANTIIESLRRQGFWYGKMKARRKDGSHFWVQVSASAVFDAAGSRIGMLTSSVNISEMIKNQSLLERSESLLSEAQRMAHLGSWELDLTTHYLYWSDELYRIFGVKQLSFGATYKAFLSCIHPEDRDRVKREFQSSVKSREPYDIVYRILRTDGEIRYVNEKCYTEYKEDGTPLRSLGTVLDITERRRAEEALKESLEKFRDIVNRNFDVIAAVDLEGRLTYVSPAVERVLGFKPEEVIGKHFKDYFPESEIPRAAKAFTEVLEGGSTQGFEIEMVRKDGIPVYIESNSSPILKDGKVVGVQGIYRDITERKLAEKAKRESEERYRRLVENMDDLIYRYEFLPRRGFTFVSSSATRITGYTPEEHYADPDLGLKIVHPEDLHLLESMMNGRNEIRNPITLRWEKKDGEIIWTEQRNVPIYDDKGNFVAVEGIARDVTDRKKTEEQIQKDLQEKTVLLNEIHHRVKNNLQVIASLLQLQSLNVKDRNVLDMFEQSRKRVFMMASVYEKLYRSQDLSRVDFKHYLEDVLNMMYQSSGMGDRISLKLNVQNVFFGLDDAIPAALLINELLTNSIKHAFPGKRKGTIKIDFHLMDDQETYRLVYKDNGVGLPGHVDFETTETLGLTLIKTLANQIEGEATFERNGWTTFTILFKGYGYAQKKKL